MVYGIIKLINFAHGDIYMMGGTWGISSSILIKFLFSLDCGVGTTILGLSLNFWLIAHYEIRLVLLP